MTLKQLSPTTLALTCALILSLLAPSTGRAQDYLLQPGDVLSVRIIGPEVLEQAVPIEMDGFAWFPIIGEVQAAGATLRHVREQVANAYSVTSIPVSAGADSVPQLIQSSQVIVSVAKYRPIYVSGDLQQPLIIDFEPGLTLRKAVVLAGVGSAIDRTATVVLEQEEALILNLARVYARIWSLKSLLGTDTQEDYDNILVADTEDIRAIVEIERSLITARTEEYERQKRTIANNIIRNKVRLAALLKQKANEEEGLKLDEQVVRDLRKLAEQGLTVTSKLAEVRRAAITSAGSVLQLGSAIEDVRADLSLLEAEAESLGDSARSEAWSELSGAIGTVHEIRADLASLRAVRAASNLDRKQVMAVITRRGEPLAPVDLALDDRDLYPGDQVDILLTFLKESQS